ncbi:MAG: hypothetical protein KAG98_00545 [Lentisphaeria bacterium]|nr:hypothetical protein [Lentisphaeria bacterium]
MFRFSFICSLLVLSVYSTNVSAQISMKLKMQTVKNLTFDPIWVDLSLENVSGNTLVFPRGKDEAGIYFDIVDETGKLALQTPIFQDPVGGFSFISGALARRKIVLSNLYNLARKGNYTCRAVIKHPSLPAEYISNSVSFEVVNPPCIRTFKVGVPLKPGETKISSITYKIMLFDKNNKPTYYARVENDDFVFSNIRLQRKNSSHLPTFVVDAKSNLHCLLYNKGKIFTYYVIGPKGHVLEGVHYMITETTPKLVKDPDIGRVMVIGGRVGKKGEDFLNYRRDQKKYQLDRARRDKAKLDYYKSQKNKKK